MKIQIENDTDGVWLSVLLDGGEEVGSCRVVCDPERERDMLKTMIRACIDEAVEDLAEAFMGDDA